MKILSIPSLLAYPVHDFALKMAKVAQEREEKEERREKRRRKGMGEEKGKKSLTSPRISLLGYPACEKSKHPPSAAFCLLARAARPYSPTVSAFKPCFQGPPLRWGLPPKSPQPRVPTVSIRSARSQARAPMSSRGLVQRSMPIAQPWNHPTARSSVSP